ncbi:MAG: DUF1934 domain-containing protein [Clostridia bacterium]|nr:DUF1934 domain-containing protein [Clostridia bacterium]
MKNDVLIKFITVQTTEDNDSDTLEINARGTLEKSDSGYIIEYSEIDEEMQGSKTTVSVDSPDCITMTREGSYNSRFIIEKGKRHSCYYDTPAGSLMMGVFASDVSVKLTENGGKLKMKYTIDFNSSMVAENSVTLSVKKI